MFETSSPEFDFISAVFASISAEMKPVSGVTVLEKTFLKGNVGSNHVKTPVRTDFDFFKSANVYFVIGMQMRKDFAGEQIFFKTDGFVIGKRLFESVGKRAVSCRRFKKPDRIDSTVCPPVFRWAVSVLLSEALSRF
ncbi:MAG: hypothetical protein LBG80_07395 [Bacteroidales bacterium]|nr:hypothetical protein [Bacteroidales bacterium]